MSNTIFHSIESANAPKAIGPYSQAVMAGPWCFCSGQIPLNAQGELAGTDILTQAKQVLENLRHVLMAANLSFEQVVRTDVFLTNLNDFAKLNEIYAQYFTGPVLPARQTVEVSKLPKGALIEISVIAYKV